MAGGRQSRRASRGTLPSCSRRRSPSLPRFPAEPAAICRWIFADAPLAPALGVPGDASGAAPAGGCCGADSSSLLALLEEEPDQDDLSAMLTEWQAEDVGALGPADLAQLGCGGGSGLGPLSPHDLGHLLATSSP